MPGWNEFYTLVLTDTELATSLRAIDTVPEFVEALVLQAQQRGYDVSLEEVQNALSTQKRIWVERWLDR